MPNPIAYAMLLIWPFVVLMMFRKMSVERALIWSILGGYLILPPIAEFSLPVIPAVDKVSIPNVMAYLVCIFSLNMRISFMPKSRLGQALMVVFLVSPILTVFTNSEEIRFGLATSGSFNILNSTYLINWGLPGLRVYDSLSFVANQFIFMIPLFLGRKILATPAAMKEMFRALMAGGLMYSLPMLLEVRLSPQLNIWIYGFFQHDFSQAVRGGGYRPFVFLQHGLWVAFFAMMALVSALVLARDADPKRRPKLTLIVIYLFVVLLACKSLGSIIFAVILLPLVALTGPHMQFRIAAIMALIAVTYPLMRGSGVIPTEAMVAFIENYSAERAQSLAYRFGNEDALLARAAEKLFFGWGSWGRNLIYSNITGELETIPDGRWIITIGTHGWVGYIAQFGLLALPLFLVWWRSRKIDAAQISRWVGPLALLLGTNMIDMLPNATLIPFTWLMAGSLLGYAEMAKVSRLDTRKAAIRREFSGQRSQPFDEAQKPATGDRPRTIL
jgi:hypothetical protein